MYAINGIVSLPDKIIKYNHIYSDKPCVGLDNWWDPTPFWGCAYQKRPKAHNQGPAQYPGSKAEVGPPVARRLFRVVCLRVRVDWNLAWLWESVLTSRMLGVALGIIFLEISFLWVLSSSFFIFSIYFSLFSLRTVVLCWFSDHIYTF